MIAEELKSLVLDEFKVVVHEVRPSTARIEMIRKIFLVIMDCIRVTPTTCCFYGADPGISETATTHFSHCKVIDKGLNDND